MGSRPATSPAVAGTWTPRSPPPSPRLGYVDSTATTCPLSYLPPGAPHVRLAAPSWLRLPDGGRLLEVPATHSIGMLVRALLRPLPRVVHVHFHDWDLLNRKTALALEASLHALRARRRLVGLDELARIAAGSAPEVALQSLVSA